MTESKAVGDSISDAEVTRFVRHTLGCNCPDDVFERINTVAKPETFSGLPVDYMIEIGGRLLVAVCATSSWREVLRSLENIVNAGRRHRDDNGFNRFRLVVITEQVHEAQAGLQAVFDAAKTDADEKIHLHVLIPAVLPGAASATIN